MCKKVKPIAILLVGMVLIAAGLQCSSNQKGKIQVTTTSQKALTDFLNGRDLMERLHFQEAYSHFLKAAREDTSFALAYVYASITAPNTSILLNNLNRAVKLSEQVSEGERLLILGVEAGITGAMAKQQEYFQQLVNLYPGDERSHDFLGTNYFSQQDYNLAIGEYRRATEINPDYSPPYNQLGYSHKYLKNYNEAEEAFRQYIKLIPEDPNPYDSYAELLMKMGKFQASIESYRKALKVDPTFINSYIGIATNLNFLQKHEEARSELIGAMEKTSTEEQKRALLFAEAVSYQDEGKYEAALEVLDKSYRITASINDTLHMADILNAMGRIYLQAGKTDEAFSKYTQSIELIKPAALPPEIIKLHKRFYLLILAHIDLAESKIREAQQKADLLNDSTVLAENRFQSWNYHQLLGSIALHEKNYDKAIGEYQRSNLQNPYNLYRIAIAYLAKKDMGKAREFAEKAAYDNTFNSMEYAFIRKKASDLYEKFKNRQ